MSPIRVLLADDHDLFRAGIRSLLDHVADVEVVAEASSGAKPCVWWRRIHRMLS